MDSQKKKPKGNWYTCLYCPPHGLSDHSCYGNRKCLIEGCPCPGYKNKEPTP